MDRVGPIAYRLREVRVDHGTHRALDIPALELAAGRLTALVGPNGAGKSTLLRLLAFLQEPSAGTVELLGAPAQGDRTALRRRATYVAQAPLLFHGTVRANVGYGLRARGTPDDGRITRALAAVGLEAFADRSAQRLSGGEAQRVAMARALVLDTPVLLLDEPFAHLDGAAMPQIEALLHRLRDAGKTLVVATHDLDQAERLGDTVLALADGRVVARPLVTRLRGHTVRRGRETYFAAGALLIELPDDRPRAAIAVPAEDVIVSRARLDSSARNAFPGRIVHVEHTEHSLVLTLDCSGTTFFARITPHAYAELRLREAEDVWVTFKASAVKDG